jgi:hypothetical protein
LELGSPADEGSGGTLISGARPGHQRSSQVVIDGRRPIQESKK